MCSCHTLQALMKRLANGNTPSRGLITGYAQAGRAYHIAREHEKVVAQAIEVLANRRICPC